MLQNPDDVTLQRPGCLALLRIAKGGEQAKKQVAAAGAVEVVASVLRRHRDESGFQNAAMLAMRQITAGSQERIARARVQLRKQGLQHIIF